MAIFGFGAQDPYAEEAQLAQDRATAFEGIKDNLPALGLIAGLSMLAHNNGSRSVGQLVGRAGADALNAYGTWQKLEEARQRQKMLDEERKEQREYDRGQDAFRNDMAERKFGLEAAKMAQDMALARQRMGLAYAGLAAQRAAAARAQMTAEEKAEYDRTHQIGADGTPLVMRTGEDGKKYWEPDPDAMMYGKDGQLLGTIGGKVNPNAGFASLDANAKKELYSLGQADALVADMIGKLNASKGKSHTGFVIGAMPATLAARYDPEGVGLRGAISNFSSQIMNALSGAAVSEQERKRLEGFLPTAYDDWDTLMAKMQAYQDFLRTQAGNWSAMYGPNERINSLNVMRGGKKKDEEPAAPKGFKVIE